MIELLETINEHSKNPFYTMNESMQHEIAEKVLDKIFILTVGKYNKINFSEIERSRGDLTKIKFYKNFKECVDTLNEINRVTNKLNEMQIINSTINNIIKLKPEFEKGFRIQNNYAIMIYNLVSYSLIESVSYVIATSINFVNDNNVIITNNSENNLLIDSLSRFNKLAEDGTIYKFIDKVEKEVMNESFIGDFAKGVINNMDSKLSRTAKSNSSIARNIVIGAGVTVAFLFMIRSIIPIIRNTAYCVYNFKHKISESAQIQAEMLEMNIKILEEKGEDPKIIVRQQKWVDRFKRLAEKFSLDYDKSSRDAKMQIKQDKVDVDSILI